jgi:hypothetical protein
MRAMLLTAGLAVDGPHPPDRVGAQIGVGE